MTMDELQERLQVLEEKFEFQDQTIDALNDVIVDQQNQMAQLEEQVRRLDSMLLGLKEEQLEDPPPPHY